MNALHPLEHLAVLLVREMLVRAFFVPRVERVIPERVQRLDGQVVLHDVVDVLVVAPRHVHAVEPDPFSYMPSGVEYTGWRESGFSSKNSWYTIAVVRAPDRERVADDGPLRLAPEAQDFAEIVDEPRRR